MVQGIESLVKGQPIRQICFFVPDPTAAAVEHNARFGSGPYFMTANYRGFNHIYRGKRTDRVMDLTSACGQFGDVMLEFTTQHDDSPSAYHDLYPNGGPAIHHFAFLVENAKAEVERIEKLGFPLASSYEIDDSGYTYNFLDTTKAFGIMTEIYDVAYVGAYYDYIKEAARGFDGKNLFREFPADPRKP